MSFEIRRKQFCHAGRRRGRDQQTGHRQANVEGLFDVVEQIEPPQRIAPALEEDVVGFYRAAQHGLPDLPDLLERIALHPRPSGRRRCGVLQRGMPPDRVDRPGVAQRLQVDDRIAVHRIPDCPVGAFAVVSDRQLRHRDDDGGHVRGGTPLHQLPADAGSQAAVKGPVTRHDDQDEPAPAAVRSDPLLDCDCLPDFLHRLERARDFGGSDPDAAHVEHTIVASEQSRTSA